MSDNPYKMLAQRLDELPNGFPATEDGSEIRILEKLFTLEEAKLAVYLRITLEPVEQIVERLPEDYEGRDRRAVKKMLKGMVRKGLIKADRIDKGIGYGLLPFVVGIYEMQVGRIDEEFAQLFEDYYYQAFGQMVNIQPTFHRVVPIDEAVRMDMEIRPHETAKEIVDQAKAWGVMDCICRKQKELIGDPCGHPIETCMIFSPVPGSFDHSSVIRALTHDEAMDVLYMAEDAGLVHTVSNNQKDTYYICNCCTCSCGLLRGMADLGIANVVASSAFINTVDPDLCIGCGVCSDYCQFYALELVDGLIEVDQIKCVGCGVCVNACPEDALSLVRRPPDEVMPVAESEEEWMEERAQARGIDINIVK